MSTLGFNRVAKRGPIAERREVFMQVLAKEDALYDVKGGEHAPRILMSSACRGIEPVTGSRFVNHRSRDRFVGPPATSA
jgi:hypothetical protein